MTPHTPNPILAVDTAGCATPLGDAAAYAGWGWLDSPTPRELLRAVFLRSHAVVIVGLGHRDSNAYGATAGRLLEALHASSSPARVVAVGYDADDTVEQHARALGVALYRHDPTPYQLIEAAQSLLPQHRRAPSAAPVADKHPTPADPAIASRVHLAKLMAHPPPARAGPLRHGGQINRSA